MDQQATNRRQRPMVVPPTDARDQHQPQREYRQGEPGLGPDHRGDHAGQQQGQHDRDAAAAWRRHPVAAALAGLIQ
ncbi:hypothetical protein D3C71_1540510 [compost metagenome]